MKKMKIVFRNQARLAYIPFAEPNMILLSIHILNNFERSVSLVFEIVFN